MNEQDRKNGERVFATICAMLDENEWKYEKKPDELRIDCRVRGDDLPFSIFMKVHPESKIVLLGSPLFDVNEEKRSTMACAVAVANYELNIGCFDFDIRDGALSFRIAVPYRDSILSTGVFGDILYTACSTVDKYNDKFFMLAKGNMTLEAFFDFVYKKN